MNEVTWTPSRGQEKIFSEITIIYFLWSNRKFPDIQEIILCKSLGLSFSVKVYSENEDYILLVIEQ